MQLPIHGLDKFQIEIDLHSKENNMYFGMFLGISHYNHLPTSRKCIITDKLYKSQEQLNELFRRLVITEDESKEILKNKYWDMKSNIIKDFVFKII